VLQGQGPVWPRPRTFAQGQGLNPQGQGQGLKICPRGQLKAKDQGQGQQHCLYIVCTKFLRNLTSIMLVQLVTDDTMISIADCTV